jgi:endoglucanase
MKRPSDLVWLTLVVGISVFVTRAPAATVTPAHETALKFMRGVSFGNYLEYRTGDPAGNQTYSGSDFTTARAEGFDHIRVPVAWHLHTGPGPSFTISNNIFTRVDTMVNGALNRGLAVLVDLHHFHDFTSNPSANREKFYAIWRQVAARYSNAPPTVAFELLNEPNGAATTAVINPIFTETIRQIRQSNPKRTIFVGPGDYNSINELANLTLPASDMNLIATVHCYDPYYFTHQGAEWALPDTATTGVLYPGPPPTPLSPHPSITHSWVLSWFDSYNTRPTSVNPSGPTAFRPLLQRAKQWSDSRNRPVHVGEFGCYYKAQRDSRVRYYQEIRSAMDGLGLGWAMWDWKAGFHYIASGRPDPPGMREAMFPPLNLVTRSKGAIEFEAAVGKNFVIEKSLSLSPSPSWIPLATQTLVTPLFQFNDPTANGDEGAYYRVQWLK